MVSFAEASLFSSSVAPVVPAIRFVTAETGPLHSVVLHVRYAACLHFVGKMHVKKVISVYYIVFTVPRDTVIIVTVR